MRFARHYAEMVIAMLAGMFVLGGAAVGLLALVGIDVGDWRTDAPALLLLGMALTMTVPMVAWMRHRGHGWGPAAEMSAAMFLPSLVAIALGGTLDVDGQMTVQHAGMFPAMLAAMLLRRSEYA
jgi:hypothetical protein